MFVCLFPVKRANYCKVKTRVGERFGENKEAQRNEKKNLRKKKEVEYVANVEIFPCDD